MAIKKKIIIVEDEASTNKKRARAMMHMNNSKRAYTAGNRQNMVLKHLVDDEYPTETIEAQIMVLKSISAHGIAEADAALKELKEA